MRKRSSRAIGLALAAAPTAALAARWGGWSLARSAGALAAVVGAGVLGGAI